MKQKELTELLVRASEAYYNGSSTIMSDHEFDEKVEELRQMEKESGTVYPGSPTQNVGAKVSALRKVTHEQPALSLDKVKYKERENLLNWLGDRRAVITWKMDGLTVVLTYDNGRLTSAVTRGDGVEGSDITHNARFFEGVPAKIPETGHIVVRGEAVMHYDEFDRVNAEAGGIYENPRNLASATIQMLDANESKKRKINFYAFELVTPEPNPIIYEGEEYALDLAYQRDRLNWLEGLGFNVVEKQAFVDSSNILQIIDEWKEKVAGLKFPTDGLVITYDDMVYGLKLGNTGHHFRHSIALKWTDETAETTIRDIEWSVGKTGVITPVAIFDPVRLGAGSTITRASLHNVSIMKSMPAVGSSFEKEPVRIGCKAWIYLANMIIPQVEKIQNTFDGGKTCPTEYVSIPDRCPICGAPTEIRSRNGFQALYCTGDNCRAQVVASLMNTFSKDGLFIKGLGESQIEDLMDYGLVNSDPLSFYKITAPYSDGKVISDRVDKLLEKDGWGKKKFTALIDAINASRETTLQKFLYSLNIPLLGNDLSKKLATYWNKDIKNLIKFMDGVRDNGTDWGLSKLIALNGIGDEKALNVIGWMGETTACEESYEKFLSLVSELKFPEPATDTKSTDTSLAGLTFVITGAVHSYKNRDEFKASVEARGGKVAGSVSRNNTNYLVNNDILSTSSKNQKAKEYGIEIITEDDFIARFGK